MSVIHYVVGLIPDTDRVKKLRRIYKECGFMKIEAPVEARAIFDDANYIEGLGRTIDVVSEEGQSSYQEWIIVKLNDLPEEIDAIAFISSC